MGADKLTAAICGLGDWGRKTLEAISGVKGIELLGAGDIAKSASENLPGELPCEFYTDQRHMIQQLKPDVVIVTTPPPAAIELCRLAAKAGCNIVRAAPPARTLDEASELRALLHANNCRMEILQPRLFMPSYAKMLSSFDLCGGIFLARCEFIFNWSGGLSWRADHNTAGGGVLLEAGFQLLDLTLRILGLPEEVYAVIGRKGRPHMLETADGVEPQGIYDTDDTAVVTLRYPSGAAASLVCSWVTSPTIEQIYLHGRKGVIKANPEQYSFTNPDGLTIDACSGSGRHADAITAQLQDITNRWLAIKNNAEALDPQNITSPCARCDTRDPSALATPCYLAAMAVLEAAYLSDRTGQNESPWRLLEARGIDPNTVLRCHCSGQPYQQIQNSGQAPPSPDSQDVANSGIESAGSDE